MKIKELLVFLAVMLATSLVVSACAAPAPAPKTAPAPSIKPAWQWPRQLVVGSGALSGAPSVIALAWGALLEKETGMKVRVTAEDSSELARRWLKHGQVDFYQNSLPVMAEYGLQAKGADAAKDMGPFQVRLAWSSVEISGGYMVRGDSKIKTIYDIKPGMTAAVYDIPSVVGYVNSLLDWIGLKKDDLKWLRYGDWAGSIQAVVDGKADFIRIAAISPALVQASAAPHGIRFIPLPYETDPKGAERFLKGQPTVVFGKMSTGVKEAIGVPSFLFHTPLVATDAMDPELGYRLAKWWDENYDRFKDVHADSLGMRIDRFRALVDYTYIPVHEGTIRYLKEKKLWTAADDKRQEYNLNLLKRYINAWQKALEMADNQKINVDPKNEKWIQLWENYKRELGLPGFKATLEIPS